MIVITRESLLKKQSKRLFILIQKMQLCLKISLVTQLECILLFAKIFIHSADLNFIHYAGELGGGTDIIPGEFEGVHFYFILIYRRSSYLARIN